MSEVGREVDEGLRNEFLQEYTRHQNEAWGGPLKYVQAPIEKAAFSVPFSGDVENFSNFDHPTQELFRKMRNEIAQRRTFIIIFDEKLPEFSGKKAFLYHLRRMAGDYSIIHSPFPDEMTFFESSWSLKSDNSMSGAEVSFIQKGKGRSDCFERCYTKCFVPIKRPDEPTRWLVPFARNDVSRLGRGARDESSLDWIKSQNSQGARNLPIIIIDTLKGIQKMEDSGLLSKILRMSNDPTGKIMEFCFNGANWNSLIEEKINNTDVNPEWLRLMPSDSSSYVNVCQSDQVEQVKQFLKIIMNMFNARIGAILSGEPGIGKSVLLRRGAYLLQCVADSHNASVGSYPSLRALNDESETPLVYTTSDGGRIRGIDYEWLNYHIAHARLNALPDVSIFDDGVDAKRLKFKERILFWALSENRRGFLGATNESAGIRSFCDEFNESIPFPSPYFRVIPMGGKDYSTAQRVRS